MKKSGKRALEIGIGVAAAAAAATYLFAGKDAAKRRKMLMGWMKEAQMELKKKLAKAETMSAAGYKKAVAEVMREYKAMKAMNGKELAAMAKHLMSSVRMHTQKQP
jgi:hypothetical protein